MVGPRSRAIRRVGGWRWIVLGALVTVLLVAIPSTADAFVKIGEGTILLPDHAGLGLEEHAYVASGCSPDTPDGLFAAIINVRQYWGRTLAVHLESSRTAIGNPELRFAAVRECELFAPRSSSRSSSEQGRIKIRDDDHLLVWFSGAAENVSYSIWLMTG